MGVPFFHIGVVVEDIDRAVRTFTRRLGLTFHEVAEGFGCQEIRGARSRINVKRVYSVDGPPYIELIEATDGGVLDPAMGMGFHHIGCWVDDIEEALRARALRPLGRAYVDEPIADTTVVQFTDPADLCGVRLELLHEPAVRPGWSASWPQQAQPDAAVLPPYFHVGFVVQDLDRAIRAFSQALGVSFPAPFRGSLSARSAGSSIAPSEHDVSRVYSREGPPYIELIEGAASGPFSLGRGEGFHHLGYWTPHALVAGAGGRGELTADVLLGPVGGDPATPTCVLTRPTDLDGVRIELLDEPNFRATWEARWGALDR